MALPSLLMGAFGLSKMSPEHTEMFQNHDDVLIALSLVILLMSTSSRNFVDDY